MGTPTEGDTMNTIDTDTADTDVLRAQIREISAENDDRLTIIEELRRANLKTIGDMNVAVALLRKMATIAEEGMRRACENDSAFSDLVINYDIIDLTHEYEIRITVPVTMTIIVSGDSEDDALESVGEVLSNEVTVDVHGVEDYDFDSYDFDIQNICKA
jgi:hypothetical protein